MQVRNLARGALIGLAIAGGIAVAAPARGPLIAVSRIEPGQWQLKSLGASGAVRTVCVANGAALIQYGHGGGKCQRAVVVNEADTATVRYVCAGTGQGQTTFKVATPRAFNLETQGILNGAPFEEEYEARRIGDCTASATAAR